MSERTYELEVPVPVELMPTRWEHKWEETILEKLRHTLKAVGGSLTDTEARR